MRIPNPWLVAGLSVAVGAVAGAGLAGLSAVLIPVRIGDVLPAQTPPSFDADAPVAEVTETTFAFGQIAVGASGEHEFTIRNNGPVPLELTKGSTSCTCTVSDFEESEGGSADKKIVLPGTSTKLKVKWRGKGDGGPYRQSASIITNDPHRPQIAFVVEGTVVPSHKSVPATIALPRLTPSASHKATAKVFTFGKEPPTVTSLALTEEKTAPFYSLASSPLSTDEIAAETGATGGFQIDLEVRPGLPLGQVRQGIKAVFRIPEEITAEIPIEGSVAGDFSFAGANWDSNREALMLGTVAGTVGTKATLFLTVKGPHRDAVRPKVREVVPASLTVTVDEPKPVGNGNVVRIPINVTIPPGSPAVSHSGAGQSPAGRIVLDTGHPETPTLEIRVCVTVVP